MSFLSSLSPFEIISICNAADYALEHCNAHQHTLYFITDDYTHNIKYAIRAGLLTANMISHSANIALINEQKAFCFQKMI